MSDLVRQPAQIGLRCIQSLHSRGQNRITNTRYLPASARIHSRTDQERCPRFAHT